MNRVLPNLILAIVLLLLIAAGRNQTSPASYSQTLPEPNIARADISTDIIPASSGQSNYKPKNGYVPNEQTAISIAVAVWIPIYGKATIEAEKPYKATLKKGVWTVTGSLPEGYIGGTAEASISRDSGCILRVIHSK